MRPVLAMTLLLSTSCLNPDEVLPFTGRLIARESSGGHPVRLLRASSDDLNECDPLLATPFKEATSGVDGEYAFELFRVEAQALSSDRTFCFRVEADFPSGSRAWTGRSQRINQDLRFPPLREWVSNLSLDAGVLTFEPVIPWPVERVLPAGVFPGVSLTHRLSVTTRDGGLAWRADDRFSNWDAGVVTFERVPLTVPDEILEDFDLTIGLQASLDEGERRRENIYELPLGASIIDPERTLELSGHLTPLSRGLACQPWGASCPFTDGRLDRVDAGLATSIELDFGQARSVHTVIVRAGQIIGGRVVLSLDGEDTQVFEPRASTWATPSSSEYLPSIRLPDGGYGSRVFVHVLFTLDGGVDASRVKVEAPGGFLDLAELSVF